MKKIVFYIVFIVFSSNLFAQNHLDTLVRTALESNDGLKQQRFVLEKNIHALAEAKGLFLPSVNWLTSYTAAAGGRQISLPVGDLMNPVYSTLNQITQSNRFPQIQNVSEQFLPNNFYDARFKVQQALINSEIYYNRKIKNGQVDLQKIEIELYQKELTKEVKTAYFRYLQASQAVKIYQNATQLLDENKRINESLIRNDMATPSVLLKIQGEREKLNAQILQAQNQERNALAYFNFLLNQPYETAVRMDSSFLKNLSQLPEIQGIGVEKREEIQKLKMVKTLQSNFLAMQKAAYLPKLGASLDLGSQGFNWQFNNQTRYVLLGVSLEVPIFNGFRNQSKIRQAQADLSATEAQTAQIQNQLQIQIQIAENNYQTAWQVYQSYQKQVEAYQRDYQDVMKRYKQGQAMMIEVFEARNDLTTAQLQQSLSLSDIWIKKTELERVK